ncbi:MMPL family transporter [Enterovibrio sp. ZSDZ42]|uniref:MMPL family transporter n=1 Tax=Enterovibrio gelatinilyticus TaxID=2899819 RepID=A0ABT5R1T8_9GAMM|nr:MMPL family transporter [Enterovibrio sp. ZSDZ42]MDD1794233.1 MMPL family transporter [Enterovibrio sp. ZSDZ42]
MNNVTTKVSSFEQFLIRLVSSVLARPKLTLIIVLGAIFALAGGLATLEVNNSARVFLAVGSPEKVALDELEANYSKDENVMFVVVPPEGESATSPKTLSLVRALTDELWQSPYARKVTSLVNFIDPVADADGGGMIVDDLVMTGEEESAETQETLSRFFEERPDVIGNLVAKEGNATTVFLTVAMSSQDLLAVKKVALHARELQQTYLEKYPDYQIYLTGLVMLDYALNEASDNDSGSLVPIMIVLVLVLIGALFRAFVPPLIALMVILLSILASVGAVAWAGIQLNTASGAAPLIILVLAVANVVHILTKTYQLRHTMPNSNPQTIILAAMAYNVVPLSLTNLTTFVGFISLNFSDVVPFGELGTIAALGVLTSLVVNLTITPVVLQAWLSRRKKPLPRLPNVHFGRLAERVCVNARWILFVFGSLGVTALLGLQLITFNDNFVEYFDDRNAFRGQTDSVQEHWGGMGLIEYSFDAPTGKTVADLAYLEQVDAFAQWLRQQPHVNAVIALPDHLARLNQAFNNLDAPTLADDPYLSSQLLTTYEISAPYGHSLTDRVTPDYVSSRLSVMTDNLSSAETIEIEKAAEDWMQQNAPLLAGTSGTGLSLAFAYVSERNSMSMLLGNLTTIVTISFLLLLAWRSWTMGIFSLIPNLLPIMIVLGIWGYFVGEINLAVSVVGAMVMGIVVDDTVYILTKYQESRKQGASVEQAVVDVYSGVGLALITTTVVIALGFAVMATSSFAINANLGLLALGVVIVALLYDFLFIPALLITVNHAFQRHTAQEV